ncbi:MAG: DUF2723 domain-containing protein [Myxococcales bacterium]|nr:DUF2723 domain-containing protein [Myxococcales bacterium]
MAARKRRKGTLHPTRARASVLVGLFALLVYLPRVAPTLSLQGDSAVFVSAAKMLGVAQPSGYPLWTFLGRLFALLPFGEVPYRLHLFSAVCHALTVGLVCHVLLRLTGHLGAAVGGALSLAFARGFFHGSLYAEVFPLLDLFAAGAIALGVELGLGGARRPEREALAFAAVAGLASAHHQMIALVAPGLLVLLLVGRVHERLRADPGLLGRCLAAFGGPILFAYGAIPFLARRQPRASWGDVGGFDDLVALVTRKDYGGLFSPHLGTAHVPWDASVSGWIEGMTRGFTLPLALGAFVGLVLLLLSARAIPDRRPLALALVLLVLFTGPIFAVLNGLEVEGEHGRAYAERFATMSAVPVALLLGLALAAIPLPAWLRPVVGLAFLLPLLTHAADVDLRGQRRGLAYAHDLLRDVPDGSLVLLSGDAANGAQLWTCGVEHRCGRSIVFSPGQMHLEWRRRQLARWHPDLVLPPPRRVVLEQGERFLVSTREIVLANAGRRRIFLSPDILDREPGLQEATQFVPHGILVEAVDAEGFAAAKVTFVERAASLARHDRCEGCTMKRTDLRAPSLETALPFAYALAYENHARVLRALFPGDEAAARLSADLEAQAELADREGILRVRRR